MTTRAPTRSLYGQVQPVETLCASERAQMYELLACYFVGTCPQQFARDLGEKESALLLRDEGGELRGFTTLMRLEATLAGAPVVAFFSGDTIIHRDYWGETALHRLWAQHVFGLAATLPLPAYWFLICSGYKTYRCLPVFFKSFYPAYDHPTPPALKGLLDDLGRQKFARQYDPQAGVVRLAGASALRPEVAPIGPERLRDQHVAFFAAANPGHLQGDELACIAALSPDNLAPAGRRMLSGSGEPRSENWRNQEP